MLTFQIAFELFYLVFELVVPFDVFVNGAQSLLVVGFRLLSSLEYFRVFAKVGLERAER